MQICLFIMFQSERNFNCHSCCIQSSLSFASFLFEIKPNASEAIKNDNIPWLDNTRISASRAILLKIEIGDTNSRKSCLKQVVNR